MAMSTDVTPASAPTHSGRRREPGARRRRRTRGGFWRRHKALTVLLGGVAVLAVVVVSWVAYLNHQIAEIPRFDAGLERPDRPPKAPGEGVTILLAGVDNDEAAGSLRQAVAKGPDAWDAGVFRSDTLMVLHLDSDRRDAQLVSIPRDTYVPIPANRVTGATRSKINAAFSWGGPKLVTRTVEDWTGIRIDHVMLIDLQGFADLSTALGGVDVTVPATVTDGYRGKTWEAGTHHIEGDEALLYVRQRAGLPGGDFDRIQRQQNFLRAVLAKTARAGTLANPLTVTRLVSDLAGYVAVDSGLGNGELRELAVSSRKLRVDNLRFATIPVTGTATVDGAGSVVQADRAAVQEMFQAMVEDDFEGYLAHHDVTELPAPAEVD